MEGLGQLALAPCSNARELLFGPDSDIEESYAIAERDLVRFESDRELLRLLRPSPKFWEGAEYLDGVLPKFLYGVAQASGWVLGNDYIPACTAQVLNPFSVM